MKNITLTAPHSFDKDSWQITFTLCAVPNQNDQLLTLTEKEHRVLEVACVEPNLVQFCVFVSGKDTPLRLQLSVDAYPAQVALLWSGAGLELYCNGALQDEEWPMGDCICGPSVSAAFLTAVEQLVWCAAPVPQPQPSLPFVGAQYWRTNAPGYKVGDCMPFFDGRSFHLYYLRDRHGHQGKWGLGAHQFAHISSKDLGHWVEHPLAVPITHQWEGSICTGSILCAQGRYYAFYAVRMSDGSAAKVSCATSDDGISFVKSERYFTLSDPYEATSVRDPEVFADQEGGYHMLLTTSLSQGEPANRLGCLAHLTSVDLINWKQQQPFLVPGYTDQPECANYFFWRGWYYLLFGNYGCTRYRMSRQPFGPWQRPAVELLDCGLYRVPKTAGYFDNRRLAVGFLSDSPTSSSYAGDAVFRELVQLPDGELGTALVPELLPLPDSLTGEWHLDATEVHRYKACPLQCFEWDVYLTLSFDHFNPEATFGLVLSHLSGTQYTLRFQPFNSSFTVSSAADHPCQNDWQRSLAGLTLCGPIQLQLVLHGNLLDCCINGHRTLVCRLADWPNQGQCNLEAFVQDGQLQVHTISQ